MANPHIDAIGALLARHRETPATGVLHIADLATAVNDLENKKVGLEKSGRHTPKGIAEAVKKFAVENTVETLRNAKVRAQIVAKKLKRDRAALVAAPLDKDDIAAALLRQEMRSHLRTLDAGKRFALLIAEEVFLEAALTAPPVLSGMDIEQSSLAIRAFLGRNFPDQIEQFEESEESLKSFQVATDTALKYLKDTLGIPTDKAFDEFMTQASEGLEDDAFTRITTEIEAEHRTAMAEARGYSDESLAHRIALAEASRASA